jgi:CBS domain-containing protein
MPQLLVEDVVRDRGSDQLFTVPAWATVGDAVDLMAERDIGAVLVMTEDGLVAASSPNATCSRAWSRPAATPAPRPFRWS